MTKAPMTESEFMEYLEIAAAYCRKHPRTIVVAWPFEFNGKTIDAGFHRFAEGPCDCGHCNPELAKILIDIDA